MYCRTEGHVFPPPLLILGGAISTRQHCQYLYHYAVANNSADAEQAMTSLSRRLLFRYFASRADCRQSPTKIEGQFHGYLKLIL